MSREELAEIYAFEDREWLESLEYIIQNEPAERVKDILNKLSQKAQQSGISLTSFGNTP